MLFPVLFTNNNPLPSIPAFTDISTLPGSVDLEIKLIANHCVVISDANSGSLADLYFSRYTDEGSMTADLCFLNQDGNTFQERARVSNFADIDGGSHGPNWAELDNDGDYDLVNAIMAHGFSPYGSPVSGPNDIYRNDGNALF